MGAIHLSDEMQELIEKGVAAGRAPDAATLIGEAVTYWLAEPPLDDDALDEIERIAQVGIAYIEAGRFTLIATPEDEARLSERLMARVRASLASGR